MSTELGRDPGSPYPEAVLATIPDPDDTFTEGECWYLSWHLNRISGWTIWAVAADERCECWSHTVVARPGGGYLDVTGVRSEAELRREHAWRSWQKNFRIVPVPESGDYNTYRRVLSEGRLSDSSPGGVPEGFHLLGPEFETATAELARWLVARHRDL